MSTMTDSELFQTYSPLPEYAKREVADEETIRQNDVYGYWRCVADAGLQQYRNGQVNTMEQAKKKLERWTPN